MRFVLGLVDWKRALLLLPVLAALAAVLYFVVLRGSTAGTPRASLLETAAVPGTSVGTTQGKLARDFLAYAPDGTPIRLSDLRGRPTVINFWATWCGSCTEELPDLRDLQAEVGPENLNIIAVNAGERSSTANGFMKWLKAPDFKVAMDPTLVVADAYGVRGMPQSVFVDSAGVIRAVYVGQLDANRMMQYVTAAQTGADATNQPGPLRFITTVARDRVLEARRVSDGLFEFRSKSLRCDDSYCAQPVLDELTDAPGVLSIEAHLERDPATVVVRMDENVTGRQRLAELLADELEQLGDPLYTRPIEIVHR